MKSADNPQQVSDNVLTVVAGLQANGRADAGTTDGRRTLPSMTNQTTAGADSGGFWSSKPGKVTRILLPAASLAACASQVSGSHNFTENPTAAPSVTVTINGHEYVINGKDYALIDKDNSGALSTGDQIVDLKTGATITYTGIDGNPTDPTGEIIKHLDINSPSDAVKQWGVKGTESANEGNWKVYDADPNTGVKYQGVKLVTFTDTTGNMSEVQNLDQGGVFGDGWWKTGTEFLGTNKDGHSEMTDRVVWTLFPGQQKRLPATSMALWVPDHDLTQAQARQYGNAHYPQFKTSENATPDQQYAPVLNLGNGACEPDQPASEIIKHLTINNVQDAVKQWGVKGTESANEGNWKVYDADPNTGVKYQGVKLVTFTDTTGGMSPLQNLNQGGVFGDGWIKLTGVTYTGINLAGQEGTTDRIIVALGPGVTEKLPVVGIALWVPDHDLTNAQAQDYANPHYVEFGLSESKVVDQQYAFEADVENATC